MHLAEKSVSDQFYTRSLILNESIFPLSLSSLGHIQRNEANEFTHPDTKRSDIMPIRRKRCGVMLKHVHFDA